MRNFTVGPVQSNETVRSIGSEQVPYFRTPEFSATMLENERLIKKFFKADEEAKAVFITGSGTASMEAVVINLFSEEDKLLIVNGGSFGQRFVEIASLHGIPYTEIVPEKGKSITAEQLAQHENQGYTGFLVNMHETSTGVLYDMALISDFCKRNGIALAVDAISAFLADPIDMKSLGACAIITGSQKALACPPGISIIVLSPEGVARAMSHNPRTFYLDLKSALVNAQRGQTPFTPAVGTLLQINARLKQIEADGGAEAENMRIRKLAEDFRTKIQGMPFEIVSQSPSNAVTALHPLNVSAYSVFTTLKDEYSIWVCPNGGKSAEYVFRVGHIGDLTEEDNTVLVDALKDMESRGLL